MKRTLPRVVIALLVLAVLVAGCVSGRAVRQKETLLVAVGFRAIPAITPEQQWLIKSLPADKVSAITRRGKVYFVYPDHFRQTLYVGHDAEYLDYTRRAQGEGLESGAWESAWSDWDTR
jgi:hypothetical protein